MRHTTQYLTRCDMCGKTNQHFYSANIGGMSYKFCSGIHMQRAKSNFERNKNISVTPTAEPETDYEQEIDF